MQTNSDSPTWRFMDNTPHSPVRKPFIGGARQLFNSGVNYKKMVSSTPAVRAQRVLDRMPRNILERGEQQELHSMMNNTFVTAPDYTQSQPPPVVANPKSSLNVMK